MPCSLHNAELDVSGRLSEAASDTWRWQARAGDRVRCDLPGHEPLDASCPANDCQPMERLLRAPAGRLVELQLPGTWPGGGIDVEWRRFGPWGEDSEPVAVRRFDAPPAEPWRLTVAVGEDRLLRLRRDGAAPETFFLPAAEAVPAGEHKPQVLRPSWPAAGGEILGFVEAGAFMPLEVLMRGPDDATSALDSYGLFARSGLAPGTYRLHARFRGGIELAGPEVRIAAGEATELIPWQLPPAGAVKVSLGEALCLAAAEEDAGFQLRRRRDSAFNLPLETGCEQRFEGLAPGRWTLSLAGEEAAVTVEAGELASLRLQRPRTWLEGLVLAGGEPLPGVELRLRRSERRLTTASIEPGSSRPEATSTDAAGHYRFELASAGAAILELRSERGFPITSRDVELSSGANRENFDLGEGRIEVTVSRADGSELDGDVTVEVWQAGEGRLDRTGTIEAGEDRALIYDLGYGRYELAAFSASGWATVERPQVELGKSRPHESIELVLDEGRAVVTVLDSAGRPVPGLLVAIDQRQLEEAVERPGEYSLLGASAGSELRVLPPPSHVPVCRMLERVESFDVVLQPATADALLVPPPGGLPPAGAFLGALEGLPGSNCGMPVSFLWQPHVDESGRELVRLHGLSPGTFRFRNADGVIILQVPGPPVPMPGVDP